MKAHENIIAHQVCSLQFDKLSEDSAIGGKCIYLKKINFINSEKPSNTSNIKEPQGFLFYFKCLVSQWK